MLMKNFQMSLLFALLLGLLPHAQAVDFNLTVEKPDNGTVSSVPIGINCGDDCTEAYPENTTVQLTASPDAGSEFTGWGGDCSGTSNPTYVIMTEDKTCTAQFEQLPTPIYDLTVVKTAHGTVTSTPAGIDCGTDCTEKYDEGTPVTLIANPDADSSFISWGGDCGSSTALTLTVTMDAAKTCTATFKLLPVELTVNKIGNGGGNVTSTPAGINCGITCLASFDVGTTVTLSATPDDDSEFVGWGGSCTASDDSPTLATVTLEAASTCTANFKPLPHTLMVTKLGGNGTVTGSHGGINCGEKCSAPIEEGTDVTLTAAPDDDYEFTGWTSDCEGTDKSTTVTMDADKLCVAHFQRLPQALTVKMFGNGNVTSTPTGIDCGTECIAAYEYDSFVKLTAQPDTGYELVGWHGDCMGLESSSTVKMDGAKTCKAYFAELPPDGHSNLTVVTMGGNGVVTSDPDGFNCDTVCTVPYESDFTVILIVTADADSSFESWGGDCTGTDSFTIVTLDKLSLTCTANFNLLPPTYNLMVTKTGTGDGVVTSDLLGVDLFGIDCGADCIAAYPEDTTVTLTAVPDFGSSFIGWSQHCSGASSSTTVTLDAAKTCKASFDLLPTYDLNLMYGGSGSGTVTSNVQGINCGADCIRYPQNTAITLTAIPEINSSFLSWGIDCTGVGNPITIALDRTKTCAINFVELPTYEVTVTRIGGGSGKIERNPSDGDYCGADCQRHYQGTDVVLTATAHTGSAFTSWGGDCSGTKSPLTVTVNGKLTCTANFAEIPTYGLTVKFAGSGNGTVNNKLVGSSGQGTQCTIDCTTTYYQGENVALTATSSANSSFVDWSGDCAGTATATTVTMDNAKTCTASFELLPPATLTVTKIGDGTGTVKAESPAKIDCGESCTEEYAANTVVVLTAVADDDSTFTGWSGSCSGTGSSVTMMMEVSKTCTASFSRLAPPGNHHLTVTKTANGNVTSEPASINCGTECTTYYPEGTVVTLTASPEAGFTFTRWSGDCSSISESVVVEMTATRICMAHFAEQPPAGNHNLTVIKTGNGTVASLPEGIDCGETCTAAYPEGTAVTLTATPDNFARFIGWEGDCSGTNSVATVTVNSTKNCFANFEWIPSSVQFSAVNFEVNEVVGQAILLVTRAGSPIGAVSVEYATADGSALAGSDYVAVTGTLTWAEGDTTLQKLAIPILLDGETETEETLSVTLSNVSSGAELGTNTQALLTIVDAATSGTSILQFAATNYAANENSEVATISVNRLGGKSGQVTVAYASSDDTAIAGSDYQTTQGTLKWTTGDAQAKTFTVPVIDDAKLEENETVTLTLSSPTGNAQLGVKTATLNIMDSLGTPDTTVLPGILQFTESTYQVVENESDLSSVTLTVSRTQGSQGDVTVNYTTQEWSARAEQDYVETIGALSWADGEADNQDIVVSILPDVVKEVNETFTVNLLNPAGNASLGSVSTATVTILDSFGTPDTTIPSDSPGLLQFAADNYQVAENGGSLTITVTRTGGSQGVVEATYTTADETATPQDYISTRNTLRWQDGDSEDKSFKISLYDDGLIEGDEHFWLKLFNPTEGAILGSNAEAIVTIIDDDATWVQFSSSTYAVDENSQTATITVNRVGGRIGQVSVAYQIIADCPPSVENCATAGEDYTAVTQDKRVLSWFSGDGYDKTVTISLHDDNEVEGNEVVLLKLSNLTGNANLGTPSETTLTIVDNDTGECAPLPIRDCYWENDGNTLQDVVITPFGTVVGGELSGKIDNQGVVQDVTLLANSYMIGGGIVRGDIRGVPEGPAILSNVNVAANSTLAYVIIASGTVVDSSVILKEGVLFEYNSLIPYMADLNDTLDHISTVGLEIEAIELTNDVLLNIGHMGILGAINGLYGFTSLNMALRQNPGTGYLLLDVESIHHAVLPAQVRQIWGRQTIENLPLKPLGLTVDPSGQVTFVTHTGREVVTLPVLQNSLAFREALSTLLELDEMTMLSNGNLKVPASDGAYYMARPNLFATDVPAGTQLGIDISQSQWLDNLVDVLLVFEASDDGDIQLPDTTFPTAGSGGDSGGALESTGSLALRQQMIYPAAADPEALYALSERSDSRPALYNDGRVYAYTGSGASKRPYKGVLDYLVTPGKATGRSYPQIHEIEDVNGDGLADYRIVYPNGDSQVMYQCAVCFE